jgi:prepilin-type N-terminal cleavage/methylation domain-containing protein
VKPLPSTTARLRAFTLIEVMVSVGVSAITLSATLGVVLFIARTGASASGYVSQASDARRAVELFGRDARQASAVAYNSATSITLTVPERYASNSNQVTYSYDDPTDTLRAVAGTATTTLCRNVTSATFNCYDGNNTRTTVSADIALIQLSLNLRHTVGTAVAQDTTVLSASFVLRNN